jgi:transcriptional activator SPT8
MDDISFGKLTTPPSYAHRYTCIVRQVLTYNSASYDILRLYDLTHDEAGPKAGAAATPFFIVPGHRTGVISQLYLDPTCNFLISTGGNRGWEGASTEVMLGYEIGIGS